MMADLNTTGRKKRIIIRENQKSATSREVTALLLRTVCGKVENVQAERKEKIKVFDEFRCQSVTQRKERVI